MKLSSKWLGARVFASSVALTLASFSGAYAQESVCYDYDDLGRIESATYLDGSQINYLYDTQGNRIQLSHRTNGVATCATPTVPAEFPGQVGAQNGAPSAVDDAATVPAGVATEIDVLVNDSDPDGHNLTITAVTQPASGTASITSNNSRVTFDAPSAAGGYSFTYTISDGNGGSDTATVTATVANSNNPPTANYDTASVNTNTSVTIFVLANDTDPDGDSLTITSVTQPLFGSNASIVNSGTAIRFDAGSFADVYVINYSISDGNGGADVGSIAVTVNGGGGGLPF